MGGMISENDPPAGGQPWYAGVTSYQWLVLVIASAGWVFDTYEAQIFNLDEYCGLSPEDSYSFAAFLERHLIEPLSLPAARVHLLNGAAGDLDAVVGGWTNPRGSREYPPGPPPR